MQSYFSRRRFTVSQVLLALQRGVWPDGSDNFDVRYIWPDEAIAINYEVASSSPDWERKCRAEFYGDEPRSLPGPGAVHRFETYHPRGKERHFICHCNFLIPAGTIVLHQYPNVNGDIVKEYIVSKDADNPQPRLDFSEHAVIRLPTSLSIAA